MRGRKIIESLRMSRREYRANIEGLNIFFGAVLGFVLAGSEALGDAWFAFLLVATAAVVITILYITASARRLSYAVLAVVLIASMERWLEPWLPDAASIPPKLQPTLLVWALMTIFVEFMPREIEPKKIELTDAPSA